MSLIIFHEVNSIALITTKTKQSFGRYEYNRIYSRCKTDFGSICLTALQSMAIPFPKRQQHAIGTYK